MSILKLLNIELYLYDFLMSFLFIKLGNIYGVFIYKYLVCWLEEVYINF